MCEHGTEVVAAGGQHNFMSRKVLSSNSQCNVTESVSFAQSVHCGQNRLSMTVCEQLVIHYLKSLIIMSQSSIHNLCIIIN